MIAGLHLQEEPNRLIAFVISAQVFGWNPEQSPQAALQLAKSGKTALGEVAEEVAEAALIALFELFVADKQGQRLSAAPSSLRAAIIADSKACTGKDDKHQCNSFWMAAGHSLASQFR